MKPLECPIDYVSQASRWIGLIILCFVAACGTDEDRDVRGEVEEPPATPTGTEKTANASVLKKPGLLRAGPPVNENNEGIEPASVSNFESSNARDVLDELQVLSWAEDDNLDPQASFLLERLRNQGADAVLPLRDFLLDGEISSPQLRQAALDVLLSIGLPEVEGIALELLANEPSAMEAWQLGHYLESIQPGMHTASIRSAAEQALIEADSAELLPGEFFVFLGQMGNEETALLLSELPAHQEAFGSVALVFIPEGGGTPMLEQDARVFEAGRDTLQGRLALQLLAQQAPQNPVAAAALIEIAEQDLIPPNLWPYLLEIVAGSWEISVNEPLPGDLVGSHTYYHEEGSQVIYRVARHDEDVADGLQEQRLYLLDKLQPFAPSDLLPAEGG
jgi:hypothetical protein